MHKFSDSDILFEAQTNKTRALELAFDLYWELLFRHAYKKLQSEELSKDIVQEVFIVMWENIEMLSKQQELLPYLYAVLRNKVLTQYKKDSVRLKYAVDVAGKSVVAEPSAHQLLLNKELQSIIDDEISKMPSRMREIYGLKKNENKNIKEIADTLQLSEQTIKNQLLNASNRLKLRLASYDPSLLKLALIISGVQLITRIR